MNFFYFVLVKNLNKETKKMIEREKIKREKIKQNEKINRLKVIWKKIK